MSSSNEESPISWKQVVIIISIITGTLSVAGFAFRLMNDVSLIQQQLNTLITVIGDYKLQFSAIGDRLNTHEIRIDRLERANESKN